jgi:hypothetical protein
MGIAYAFFVFTIYFFFTIKKRSPRPLISVCYTGGSDGIIKKIATSNFVWVFISKMGGRDL